LNYSKLRKVFYILVLFYFQCTFIYQK